MADRILLPIALDANGDPVAGAEAYFYLTGTSTPATVYAEAAATTPLASPQLASSAGVFETPAFSTVALRIDLKDPVTGTSLPGFPQDTWYLVPQTAGSASGVSFSPVTGNAATDVQTAIENNVTALATVTGTTVTIGAGRTLDVSGGTLVLANGQIEGAKVAAATFTTRGVVERSTSAENVGGVTSNVFPDVVGVKEMIDTHGYAGATQGTAVSASGTTVDFTSIPAGVNRITVMIAGLSTSGTNELLLQIGDSGGVETTGYTSAVELNGNSSTSTAGFIVARLVAASDTFSGNLHLHRLNGNIWTLDGRLAGGGSSGGDKTLSAELDRVRITTVGGSDTFDAGSININYE